MPTVAPSLRPTPGPVLPCHAHRIRPSRLLGPAVLAAFAALSKLIKVWQTLAEENPDEIAFRGDLGSIYFHVGVLVGHLPGQAGAAVGYLEKSETIQERLAREHPETAEYRADLARGQAAVELSRQQLQRTDPPAEEQARSHSAVVASAAFHGVVARGDDVRTALAHLEFLGGDGLDAAAGDVHRPLDLERAGPCGEERGGGDRESETAGKRGGHD